MQQQKLMLIDSMTKLITHISNHRRHQLEIYSNLSRTDILKIISNFDDRNPVIRKVSAQLLCELLYNNPEVKSKFLSDMGIEPPNGNIVLGKIHNKGNVAECLLKIKNSKINMTGALCWYTSGDKGTIQTLKRGQEFIDPLNLIFGITCEKQQISQPLKFMQASDRLSSEKQKQYNRQNITRPRAENNTVYVASGNKELLLSSRRAKQQSKPSSTYRNTLYSSIQSPIPHEINISSLKSPVISQIRTVNHAEQGPISFQGKLKQPEGLYVPKTTRYTTAAGEGIGFIRTTRDSSGLNSSLQSNYIRMGAKR